MTGDAELDRLLLRHVHELHWRKSMMVIAKAMDELPDGFVRPRTDDLLDRCIARLNSLAAEGRIEAAGDLSQPRWSEVRLSQRDR